MESISSTHSDPSFSDLPSAAAEFKRQVRTETMINPKKILLLVSSFPGTGVWFAWYFDKWELMILCLLLAVPIMMINAYLTRSVNARIIEICIIMSFYLPNAIYAFSKLYEERGLLLNNEVVHSFSSSLYFSIVTWTTLGYGDFQPTESVRLWAATEGMFGYVFMAFLIACFTSLLLQEREGS